MGKITQLPSPRARTATWVKPTVSAKKERIKFGGRETEHVLGGGVGDWESHGIEWCPATAAGWGGPGGDTRRGMAEREQASHKERGHRCGAPGGGYSQLVGGEREDRCTDTADQWKPSNSDVFTVSRLLRKSTKDAEFGFRVNNVPPTPGP